MEFDLLEIDLACEKGDVEKVKYLYSKYSHYDLQHCVYRAIEHGHLELVKYLFSYNPKEYTSFSYHPKETSFIKLACKKGNLPMIRFLHSKGCDVEDKDYATKFAINYAIEHPLQDYELFTYLQ